jgi:hypothetical protein
MGGARSHADLSDDCDACHTSFWGDEYMRDRCLNCHTEVQSQISELGTVHYKMNGALACRSCHTEHKGAAARITRYETILFPHDRVGFSLLAHQDGDSHLGCLECHKDTVRSFRVGVCQDCHSLLNESTLDEHNRIFGKSCLGCHDGIESYGKNFHHGDSEFPLEGKHLNADCESCHYGASDLEALKETPRDCYVCHEGDDFHAGSFGLDCDSCHTALAWDAASYDHDKTQFKLNGKHVVLTCEACHAGVELVSVSSECVSCHGEDDFHLGGLGNQCQVCHRPTGWEDAFFDHTVTEFQLGEDHALLVCNDCHARISLSEIPTDCYGCH